MSTQPAVPDSEIPYSELVAALAKPGAEILKSLSPEDCHLWHMASCIPAEGGELFDAVKKHVIYRKPIDRANAVEELGDLEFYQEAVRAALGITREEVLATNRQKLSTRYAKVTGKLAYTDQAAQERADKKEEEVDRDFVEKMFSACCYLDRAIPVYGHATNADRVRAATDEILRLRARVIELEQKSAARWV